MFSRAVLTVLALTATLPATLANIYVTSPVKGTSWTAGQNQTISWQESGTSPSLAQFGLSKVSVYVGNQIEQTSVQEIASNVDVSSTASIVFTPNPSAGANGDYYFIRFESLSLKNPNDTAYPAEAFSATFSLSEMTGSFNQSVQAEIDGASTAPVSAATSAAAGLPTAAASTTPLAKTAAAQSASPSASASVGAAAANGAPSLRSAAGGVGAVVAVAAAFVGSLLL